MSDRELAFFFNYRRTEFMAESQNKIQLELQKRNLTEFKISELISISIEPTEENCPRCRSNNFMEITDTELRNTKYGGYEVEINSRKCRICGYNAQKDKPINWKVRMNRFFGKYNWKKLK